MPAFNGEMATWNCRLREGCDVVRDGYTSFRIVSSCCIKIDLSGTGTVSELALDGMGVRRFEFGLLIKAEIVAVRFRPREEEEGLRDGLKEEEAELFVLFRPLLSIKSCSTRASNGTPWDGRSTSSCRYGSALKESIARDAEGIRLVSARFPPLSFLRPLTITGSNVKTGSPLGLKIASFAPNYASVRFLH